MGKTKKDTTLQTSWLVEGELFQPVYLKVYSFIDGWVWRYYVAYIDLREFTRIPVGSNLDKSHVRYRDSPTFERISPLYGLVFCTEADAAYALEFIQLQLLELGWELHKKTEEK